MNNQPYFLLSFNGEVPPQEFNQDEGSIFDDIEDSFMQQEEQDSILQTNPIEESKHSPEQENIRNFPQPLEYSTIIEHESCNFEHQELRKQQNIGLGSFLQSPTRIEVTVELVKVYEQCIENEVRKHSSSFLPYHKYGLQIKSFQIAYNVNGKFELYDTRSEKVGEHYKDFIAIKELQKPWWPQNGRLFMCTNFVSFQLYSCRLCCGLPVEGSILNEKQYGLQQALYPPMHTNFNFRIIPYGQWP